MKKVISFSLWGNNPKYCIGAIRNAELAPIIYPDWKCRFYVSKLVDKEIIDNLLNLNCEIVLKQEPEDWTGMFWRFEAGHDNECEAVIFRDTDSRLNLREKAAVDEWLNSDITFHIMRDHPAHNFPILGGMWGIKPSGQYDLENLLKNFKKENHYGIDYNFFISVLYPLIENDKIVHDEFFEKKSFPLKRDGYQFVGEVFDENDQTFQAHVDGLKSFLSM